MNLIADSIDFKQYLLEAEGNEKVVSASSFLDRTIDYMFGDRNANSPTLPWQKVRNLFQLRPGEVTLWAGINGHGKTMVTSQIALHLLVQNQKVCIASFEMKGEATMARMATQAFDGKKPTPAFVANFMNWTSDKLFLYDQLGICTPEMLRGVMLYAAKKLGCTHFFIDSMMKVVKGDDDYSGQKNFVNEVCSIAQDTGMHIHLIAHVRKGERETDMPDKFSVKGSSSVTDQVDNAVIIFRNKLKEEKLQRPNLKPEEIEALHEQPDTLLNVTKQRHYPFEGKISLWLGENMTYRESREAKNYSFAPPAQLLPSSLKLTMDDAPEVEHGFVY